MNRRVMASVTALGASSVITLVLMMREFLGFISANELVLAILLANWLFLTGIGSYLGRFVKPRYSTLAVGQMLVAVLPPAMLFSVRVLRNVLFLPGTIIGPKGAFLFSLAVLAPFCMVFGAMLTIACARYRARGAKSIAKVYMAHNMGYIAGGVIFSFFLVFFLSAFYTAFLVLALNLACAFAIALGLRNRQLAYSALLVSFFAAAVVIGADVNSYTMHKLYPGQSVVHHEESLYGSIVVTEDEGQIGIYQNSVPLVAANSTRHSEEAVHYALSQLSRPLNVLLIGGAVAGTPEEVAKYGAKPDYVEIDPRMVGIGLAYTDRLADANVITADARLYVEGAKMPYDAVIIDLPPPKNAQLNRYYTVEFFRKAKRLLSPGGVLALSLPSSENYIGEQTARANSAVYKALGQVFSEVMVIPGNQMHLVAGDRSIDYDIAGLLAQKGILNDYVNEYYLVGSLTEERIVQAEKSLTTDVPANSDFEPVAYYYNLKEWLRIDNVIIKVFFIVLLVALVLYLTHVKPVPFAIFSTGLAAASLQVVLLMGFQILWGYVYYMLSVIVTLFMAGLVIGTYFAMERLSRLRIRDLSRLDLGLGLFCILTPLILFWLQRTAGLSRFIVPVMSLCLGLIVGIEFPLASRLHFRSRRATASKFYNADFIGAAFGALVTGILLVPVLGIFKACVAIAALKLVSAAVLMRA